MKLISQILLFCCVILLGNQVFTETGSTDFNTYQNIFCCFVWVLIFFGCGVIVNLFEKLIKYLDEIE